MLSIYRLSMWLSIEHGYKVVGSDYRKWGGWTWLRMRMPSGQVVTYRKKGLP